MLQKTWRVSGDRRLESPRSLKIGDSTLGEEAEPNLVNEELARQGSKLAHFPIRTLLRYRIRGERVWREGMTISISKVEVRFEGDATFPPGTRMEMRFALPVQSNTGSSTNVSCHGTIVSEEFSGRPVVAARISAARLGRR